MSNKICPNCGTVVDGLQGLCPNCGFEFPVTSKANLTAEHSSFQEDDGAFDTEYYQNQNSSRYKPRVFVAIFICIIAVVVLWNYDWNNLNHGCSTKEEVMEKLVKAGNDGDIDDFFSCFDENLIERMGQTSKTELISDLKENMSKRDGSDKEIITGYSELEKLSSYELSELNQWFENKNVNYHISRAYKTVVLGFSTSGDNINLPMFVYSTDGSEWYILPDVFQEY